MANAKLTRKKVLFVKLQPGDAPETVGLSDALPIYMDTAASFGEMTMNSRAELASATLSNRPDVVGLLAASVSGRTELKGSGDPDTVPELDALLQAASMERATVKKVEIAPATTAVPRGALLEFAPSGAGGRLVVPVSVGDDFIYLQLDAGSPLPATGDAVSELVGQVTALGADTAVKVVQIGGLTGGCLQVGDTVTGQTSGATGRVERATRNGDRYLVYSVLAGTIQSGEVLKVRTKSTYTLGAPTDARAVPVNPSTLTYQLRAGVAISGGAGAGTVLLSYDGGDALYFTGAGGFVAANDIETTPWTGTAQADGQQAGYLYRPTSEDQQRATVVLWEDGHEKAIHSAMFSWSVSAKANELPLLQFNTLGPIALELTKDNAVQPEPVFAETVPAPFRCAELTLRDEFQQFQPVVSGVSMDLGNNVSIRQDANSCSGARGSIVTSRAPSGSLDVEQVPVSDYDMYSKLFSGQLAALALKFGCGAGNTVWVFADAIQYSAVEESDNGGLLTNTVNFGAKMVPGTTGDNELELVFI